MSNFFDIERRVGTTGRPHLAPAPEAAVAGAWKVVYRSPHTAGPTKALLCADRAEAYKEAARLAT